MDTRTRSASPTGEPNMNQAPTPPLQDKISAYYSLVFPHYTFYIQTLSITIGRRCAPNAASSSAEQAQVDVDLGALKSVSRLHAKIEYDQDEDRFVLVVIGRNGAWVDGVWTCAGTRAPLSERSLIQIASRTFHFVLPPPPPPEDSPSPSSQSSAHRPRSPSVDITSISPPSSQLSHSPPLVATKLTSPPSPPHQPPISPPVPPPPISSSSTATARTSGGSTANGVGGGKGGGAKGKGKQHPKPAPPPPPPEPELPNSNSILKSGKLNNSKKRKKSDVDPPPVVERPKPEDMPPKPPFTYAQLIYRAIKDINGKATLQEICNWIMTNYEYYRYADGAWMSSVRHNLSSGRAFLKMERCGGDRGKGFFWSIDEKHAKTLEEQELRSQEAAAAAAAGLPINPQEPIGKGRKKDKMANLEPPLKRSIKGDMKGTPLPPPLTSTPLAFKGTLGQPPAIPLTTMGQPPGGAAIVPKMEPSGGVTSGVFAYPQSAAASSSTIPPPANTAVGGASHPNPYAALAQQPRWPTYPPPAVPTPSVSATTTSTPTPSGITPTSSISASAPVTTGAGPLASGPSTAMSTQAQNQPPSQPPQAPTQSGVPDVVIPIMLGPIPPGHADYVPNRPNNSAKEGYMILHERKLILDPNVFSGLTKEMLDELEKMGARAALGVLAGHMVRALKEKRARERGKGVRRPKGGGAGGGTGVKKNGAGAPMGAPFTKVPLEESRKLSASAVAASGVSKVAGAAPVVAAPGVTNGAGAVAPPTAPAPGVEDPGSPLIVVDDSEDDAPAAKRRRVDEVLS